MCTYLIKLYAVQYDIKDLWNKLLIVDCIIFMLSWVPDRKSSYNFPWFCPLNFNCQYETEYRWDITDSFIVFMMAYIGHAELNGGIGKMLLLQYSSHYRIHQDVLQTLISNITLKHKDIKLFWGICT